MGPPPPGATRELGILAIRLLPKDIRLGGRFVNAREASLFTGVRVWKVFPVNFAITAF